MLILYTLNGCPFCEKVISFFDEMGLIYENKPINVDENKEEMSQYTDKQAVPYFYDTEKNFGIHESEDIISYVQEHYMEIDDGVGNENTNEGMVYDDEH